MSYAPTISRVSLTSWPTLVRCCIAPVLMDNSLISIGTTLCVAEETKNLAKTMPAIAKSMKATLDTYLPYVPALTPANLACYNCSFDVKTMWQGYPGPGCIAKQHQALYVP